MFVFVVEFSSMKVTCWPARGAPSEGAPLSLARSRGTAARAYIIALIDFYLRENMSEVQFKRFVVDALRSNEVALKSLDKRLVALDKRLAAFDAPTCSGQKLSSLLPAATVFRILEQIISFFSNFAEIAVPSLKPKPDFLLVPNEVFGLKSMKMLIPSEYLKLYECLELFSADDDASPILIRGNPGTGKQIISHHVLL